jgi:hypothetical protein
MSTAKNVSGLLNRLNSSLKPYGDKTGGAGGKNFKAEREKAILKFKSGNNYLVFFTPTGAEDPFKEWGFHAGLQEVSYYTVPCDKFNKGEECIVCNVVDSLKKQDFKGNMHVWKPIEQQVEYYGLVVNAESAESLAQGPKWVKLAKSIMLSMVAWLNNLEKGEAPFYDIEEPMKVIVTYNPEEIPQKKYSLDKKNIKPFSADQIQSWLDSIPSIDSLIYSKQATDLKKMVDEYFERIENEVATSPAELAEVADTAEVVETIGNLKLNSLKKK